MTTKQKALAANIPKFISRIDASGADYRVAIATSDIGTSTQPGILWGCNLGACDTVEGDDGLLQAIPCTERIGALTGEATAACKTLCPDSRFAPLDGKNFRRGPESRAVAVAWTNLRGLDSDQTHWQLGRLKSSMGTPITSALASSFCRRSSNESIKRSRRSPSR